MISSSIKDHHSVLELLAGRENDLETFKTYAPANRFIEAWVSSSSLSFSVSDEDGSVFAMALGENPKLIASDRLAVSRGVPINSNIYEHRVEWDFYAIDTAAFANETLVDESPNSSEIKSFLELHAPTSSIWPGNKEIIIWGEKRVGNLLVAVGALVKWRTGQVMFASIATHTDYRGQGIAQKLVRQMLASAYAAGIFHVGLGVFAENFAAKRAYEGVGFNLINKFSSYALIAPTMR